MEAKFTGGEWSVDTSGYFTRVSYNDLIICNEIHSHANAHLIAAAPDMYKSLETHLRVLNDLYPSDVTGIPEEHMSEFIAVHNLINETQNLLAKARGEK